MKNKYSSFFLYFDDKKELNEVNLALFNICKKDNFKLIAKNTIHNLKKVLTEGNKFYVILKILTLKSMIKKRQNTVTSEMNNSNIKFKNNYSKRNIIQKDDIEIGNSSIKDDEMPNLYAKKSTNQTNNDFQFSENMPLISNIFPGNENTKNNKSINDLVTKIQQIKNIIPNKVLNEKNDYSNKNGISFEIQEGIKVNNYSDNNANFKLHRENCDRARFIFFDKNKPEILLKDNNINDKMNINLLSCDNINEISNIIKNSSNNLHDEEENNLIILGPKIDNDIGINYKYKNKDALF